jgi:hypothetical protein
VTEILDGELLVYDLDGDIALHLNRTAALVWRSCDGRRTVPELMKVVSDQLGETPDEDVVMMALDSLSDHGLIDSGFKERDGAAVALSRRRFFRRAGLVGAAAINAPVVYSMSAPLAAAALSGGGTGNTGFTNTGFTQSTSPGGISTTPTGSSGENSGSSGETTGSSGGNTGSSGAGSSGAGSSGAGSSGGGSSGGGSSYP